MTAPASRRRLPGRSPATQRRPPPSPPPTPTPPAPETFPAELPQYPRSRSETSFSEEDFRRGLKEWNEQRRALEDSDRTMTAAQRALPLHLLPCRNTPRQWRRGEPSKTTLTALIGQIALETFDEAYTLLMDRSFEPYAPRLIGDFAAPAGTWLVNGWIPANRLTVLRARPGAGATRLAVQLAGCVAAGEPLWIGGREALRIDDARQCDVVYASWDLSPPELRRIAEGARPEWFNGKAVALHALGNLFRPMSTPAMFSESNADPWTEIGLKILNYANKHTARLIVIDSVNDAFPALPSKYVSRIDQDLHQAMRNFTRVLDWLARTHARTVVALVHDLDGITAGDDGISQAEAAAANASSVLRLASEAASGVRLVRDKSPFAANGAVRSLRLDGYPFYASVSKGSEHSSKEALLRLRPFWFGVAVTCSFLAGALASGLYGPLAAWIQRLAG